MPRTVPGLNKTPPLSGHTRSRHKFQQLSVFFQPDFCFFHGRGLGANDIPEPGSVISLDEVGQFMNYGVVNDKHGRFDQAPVEIDIVVHGAGTPAVKIVDYFGF